MVLYYNSISSFMQKSGDGNADPLKYFDAFHASCSFLFLLCP
jgi:hypothetical protein